MEIRIASENDYNEIVSLCKYFNTSPLTFDKEFLLLSQGNGIQPSFAKVIINSQYTFTIVMSEKNNILGFITVGVNPFLSNMLHKKIGNILLLVVKPEYQGKGFGKALVKKGVLFLKSLGAELITVSTDIYNIPAICAYESNGFKFRMSWHIFRYFNFDPRPDKLNEFIEPIVNIKKIYNFYDSFYRPFSLLYENTLDKSLVKDYLFENLLDSILKGKIFALEYTHGNKAILTYQYDEILQEALQTDKRVVKILDILFLQNIDESEKNFLARELLSDIKNRLFDACLVEMWVRSEDQYLIKTLEKNGFSLSYTGVYLHYKF